MSISHWMTIAILMALPFSAVTAQDKPKQSDPANPVEVVPAPVYESAFSGYRPSSEFRDSPDTVWRSANNELGSGGSHAGHNQEPPAVRETQTGPGASAAKRETHAKNAAGS